MGAYGSLLSMISCNFFYQQGEITMKTRSVFLGLLVVLLTVTPTLAVPTDITVRVRAKDAKFVGDTMGGARVTIRDAETGELLAKGVTTGTTGDTGLIMKIVNPRGKPISDEKAAKFTATIDIDEPRLIEVSAYGPLANRQAANRVSATQWVVPGKHITGGDAWMIELPGFVVDVQAPPLNTKLNGLPQDVKLEANVILM